MTDPEILEMLRENNRILKALEASAVRVTAPVLTPGEALRLVGKRSVSSLYDWLKKHGVKPVSQGRYSRAQIERALADEAGVSFRRHQASKRRVAP
jgi:hypothetical protein